MRFGKSMFLDAREEDGLKNGDLQGSRDVKTDRKRLRGGICCGLDRISIILELHARRTEFKYGIG